MKDPIHVLPTQKKLYLVNFLRHSAELVKKVYVDTVTDTNVNSPDKKQNQTKKKSFTWLCRALSSRKGV